MLRRRKRITLGNRVPLAATSSPKPRSWVSRIRSSASALTRMAGIGQTFQPLCLKVRGVVAEPAQQRHGFRRNTHIGQEFHAAGNSSAGWTLSSAS